jgi:hypothetical protein
MENPEVIALKKEIRLMRQLATRQGFFQYYFEELPRHRTNVECFHTVNDKYCDLFGEWRYESYDSFRKQANHYNKNKK